MPAKESPSSAVFVLLPRAEESWEMLALRVEQGRGGAKTVLLCLAPRDQELAGDSQLRQKFLAKIAPYKDTLILATKQPAVIKDAQAKKFKVVDRLRQLRTLLKDHPQADDVVRLFSPHYWRQELKARLQRMGLLSLPTVRVYLLVLVSVGLFSFVAFRLLPSATIEVWPRQEPVTHTINVFLAGSGASKTLPPKVRQLELLSLKVTLHHSLTFTDVSKEFIGTSAKLPMTIVNKSTEEYGLKKDTRLVNQAGMIFRLDRAVVVPPGGSETVPATSADKDIYQQIIGDRGNVPTGLKWDIPGLPEDVRPLVYGTNPEEGKGGSTAYRTVLQQEDLETAKRRLEQELLIAAKQEIEEARREWNADHPGKMMELLSYDELTRVHYENMVLPTEFLGQQVTSAPVEGDIAFRMFAYDAKELLALLRDELLTHIRDDKRIVEESLTDDHLDVRVIAYDDDFHWVKLTVELVGTQQYILDPLSVNGALFAKRVREQVNGKSFDESLRIVRNMPEVDRVHISLWPPWDNRLPTLPSNISVTPHQ